MKRFMKLLTITLAASGFLSFAYLNTAHALPVGSFADAKSEICDGIGGAGGGCGGGNETALNKVLKNGVKYFSIIVGVVAVIMIVVAGFKYITSGGDAGKVASAKTTLIYAIVGIILVAIAQFLVKFVVANLK